MPVSAQPFKNGGKLICRFFAGKVRLCSLFFKVFGDPPYNIGTLPVGKVGVSEFLFNYAAEQLVGAFLQRVQRSLVLRHMN